MKSYLSGLLLIRDEERNTVFSAFGYFSCLMFGYYLLRPLRESLAVSSGHQTVPWLFTGTFFAMLAVVPVYGYLVSRYSQKKFLPAIYLFFIFNLFAFVLVIEYLPGNVWTERVYFVWLSVFNLFIVSVFWSFMANVFNSEQAKRLFGFIAAAGSLTAILSSAVSSVISSMVDIQGVMLFAILMLGGALYFQLRLINARDLDLDYTLHPDKVIGGSIFAGATTVVRSPYLFRISVVLVLMVVISTIFYYAEIYIVEKYLSEGEQHRRYFSLVNLGVNVVAFVLQFFMTGRLLRRYGAAWTLAIMPAFTLIALIILGLSPTLLVIGLLQVFRRGGEYGLMKPARDLLYTQVTPEEKFKSKNFIDTAIYRGGDVVSGHLYRLLHTMANLSIQVILLLMIPLAAFWIWISWTTGKVFEQKGDKSS